MKKIILRSFITLPLSILVAHTMDKLMGLVMGGVATTKGFPIPYYKDIWQTSEIDYFVPLLKYVDIGILYILITLVVNRLFKK